MNTTNESHDFPRVRMRRETRQKLKMQALKMGLTMQAYLDWLMEKEIAASQAKETLQKNAY